MSGNTFGKIFKIVTWGESHGGALGVVIDGCPARIKISTEDIQVELNRRRPGQSKITSDRQEYDQVQILSGVFEGETLGTPISLLIWNKDVHSTDYNNLKDVFRPSHADYTYQVKYGIRDYNGGGRSSARETVARVAAGAIAKKILQEKFKIDINAYTKQVYNLSAEINPLLITRSKIEQNIIRCPDQVMADKMIKLVEEIKKEGETVGGIIECVAKNIPTGWGEPVFDRLESRLAQAMLSLPATKGFEIGSGFESCKYKGSEHNDVFYLENDEIKTKTNFSGGVQGGISNGQPVIFRVVFKPVATIFKDQVTLTKNKKKIILKNLKGRHDPCVLPRAVPIVEAMTALTLVDFWLMQMRN